VDVTVVGSGPNGLAAAVVCARAGLQVQVLEAQPTPGGGARTAADPEYPGVSHDICSAVHPLALGSPFFAEFDLRARGVGIAVPEICYANPLEGREAAIAYRDLERTCEGLDRGDAFGRLLRPLVDDADSVVGFLLGDKRSLPHGYPTLIRLAQRMAEQGTPVWTRSLPGEQAGALFTGVAAHTIAPLPSMTAAGAGMLLATLAHWVGWPIPVGGSQAITDALIADLRAHGGELHLDAEVTAPPHGVAMLDTAPTALPRIYRDRIPSAYAKRLQRYTFGPGVAKVDFVLSADVPWSDPRLAGAATLHLWRRPSRYGPRRGRRREGQARGPADDPRRAAAHRRSGPRRRRRTAADVDLCSRAREFAGGSGGNCDRVDRAVRAGVPRRRRRHS
jgi:phytoene dehydrogenase-like protein